MLFYGLTADKIKRIIRNPKRVEKGVAENTIAVMIPGANKKKLSEIWVMYQRRRDKRQETRNKQEYKKNNNLSLAPGHLSQKIIISAWRYPGISPVGKQIPIPADILEELKEEGIIK